MNKHISVLQETFKQLDGYGLKHDSASASVQHKQKYSAQNSVWWMFID